MKTTLSSPWVCYYREIEALFKEDPDVRVTYDDADRIVRLYVKDADKAEALGILLSPERTFGSVVLKVEVVPANEGQTTGASLIEKAFRGNPALSRLVCEATPFGEMNYAVFRNCVVQYFNDDLGDINGLRSTLYQEIAKDVFESVPDVHFCTEKNGCLTLSDGKQLLISGSIK